MSREGGKEPVAIIGVGLRLPGADRLATFGAHLAAGRSLISQVPANRWNAEKLLGDPARGNRTSSIWGGFVEDADCFDASFFGISPREAAWMDPQQRFALEMAWHAIEDAGYRASDLAGSRTGVYMGVCHWDYAELLEKHLPHVDAYLPTGIAFSIIANRVSHFLDLQGPSITNDTACAASMTSVYEAVRALQGGECDMALAGGVNLIWSPNHFVAFSKAGMLSKTGRSNAFDDAADGYVRGEGGAVLLLKPLKQALADGDPIHAVIRGIGVNHGGRTNSLTVTNPRAQAALIKAVHREAGVAPDTVSYVEAHGPGTPLGDPIEISGLKEAFADLHAEAGTAPREASCGIGSVKTNIGHLEGAAGVAGIVKVLIALAREELPGNVGFTAQNRLVDLAGTPFRIQKEASSWPRTEGAPRRACVSSFGFGGSNAHVLIEEAPKVQAAPLAGEAEVHLLPLSAADEERLQALLGELLATVEAADAPALADLAHTLRIGRAPLEVRTAFLVRDRQELAQALHARLGGTDHPAVVDASAGATGEPLHDLALRFVSGEDVDWLAAGLPKGRRVRAPLYPFARERHWMDESLGVKDDRPAPHPMIHRNISGFAGPVFESSLRGPELFWADHKVRGRQILPGVAALEMARGAADLAGAELGSTFALEDVVWSRPIAARETPMKVETHLTQQADRRIGFTIRTAGGEGHNVRGTISPSLEAAPSAPVLSQLQGELREEVPVALCYERLRASGVDHGPAFRAMARVTRGSGRVLAQLKLPRRLHPTLAALPLHPVMLDAAIQAWIALDETGPTGAAVPFACRRVVVQGACEPVMWALVTERGTPSATAAVRHLDIHMLDRDGNLRVSFEDLALRIVASDETAVEAAGGEAADDLPLVLAESRWRPAPAGTGRAGERDVSVLLAGFDEANFARNLSEASGQSVSVLADVPDADDPAAAAAGLFDALHARIVGAMRDKPRRPRHFLVLAPESLPQSVTAPLAALLRTAATENPKISGALVRVEGLVDAGQLSGILRQEALAADTFTELRYRADGSREALRIDPVDLPAGRGEMKLDPDGAYWITGGAGGLGLILTGWLAARGARKIVLSGRSAQEGSRFEALRAAGAAVTYAACDMGDAAAVDHLAQRIAREIGPLKGVIHAAGLLDDGYILTQAGRDFAPVFAPKLAGTLNLDRATRAAPLDFLVLFSSVAARFGNAGQAAYAGANGFLDGFAAECAALVARGERQGRTLAVAWPLWAEGGMSVDMPTLEAMERRFGTVPLPSEAGLAALERLLVGGQEPCATVLYGDTARIGEFLSAREGVVERQDAPTPSDDPKAAGDDAALARQGALFVRDILADVLELDPSRIRLNRKLEEYGLDSISIVETTNRLEERLGSLSKTLFFEYVDLEGVAGHLVENHRDALAAALAEEGLGEAASPPITPVEAPAEAIPARSDPGPSVSQPESATDAHAIAIVGLSLHVSGAATQDEFWEMLAGGIHGFRPYPQERWNHAALLHPERDVLGKTVVRTGCFLDDIDRFDPRYFRISQTEAELMSPEVRLFLQASVEAFENAGYSRETLQRRHGGDVAVIVGSMTNEYDLYGFQNMLMRGSPASGSYTGTVPNMVSYYYGFTGPSYFLDTMCSAASTCVHEAVHMLRSGRCEMALAGGVSLLLHPQKLIATSQEHFTTKSADVIRGYGVGAEGTILGEGVGALVLKRLCDAERDGDHIHGVIIGTGISNAGVRNGFTVPNPHQQAVAIERALDDAGITADTVSYIEGHGSGTALGDPIEVKALTQAFRKHTDAVGACPIGTVKSNVGHLLGASGLAGIAKVVAQLGKGMLAPSLHAETLNPDIPFASSPFRVQRELAPWQRSVGPDGRELPRRAGVTSIGAGGMNSHILIEEYRPQSRQARAASPELLVFSAMNRDRLVALVRRHLDWLERHPDADLSDIAFTLQVGRTELPCRLALAASDPADARRRLADFAVAPDADGRWHHVHSILDVDPPEEAERLAAAVAARDLEQLADAWAHGAAIDWFSLWRDRAPRRVPLPTYPFEKIRCWYPEQPDVPSVVNPLGSRLKLHPFVGRNVSTLSGLRYETDIHLGELLDYVQTRGRKQTVLPMVAVETVAALARIAGLSGPVAVEELQVLGLPDWPAVKTLVLTLEPAGDGFQARVVARDGEASETPWLQARVATGTAPDGQVDLDALKAASPEVLDHARIYGDLARNGLGFGPYLEGIARAFRLVGGGLLCELREEGPQQDWFRKNLALPSTALGAGWQALELLVSGGEPLALAGVTRTDVSGGDVAAVLCQPGSSGAFDLSFLDRRGRILARCAGVAVVPVARFVAAASSPAPEPVTTVAGEAGKTADWAAQELRRIAAGILKFNPDDLGLRDPFHDLGFDSISLTRYAGEIGSAFGIELSPAIFFECEHVEALAEHLVRRHDIAPPAESVPAAAPHRAAPLAAAAVPTLSQPVAGAAHTRGDDRIAIVGMAGRFPGSPDIESFFDNLLAGRDLTRDLPLQRYGEAYRTRVAAASFPRRGGFLADIDRFDAAAFRISPAEAERMDPQQRLLLETAWHAVENAGLEPSDLPKATGVFVGVTSLDYAALLAAHGVAADGHVATGNSLAMVANRVSHAFDLSGPSEAIDTACSSSLVALLRAAQALKDGRCETALVGGVNLCLTAEGFEGPHNAGMLSPDGRCKSFGAGADGYARGEGVAVLVLKRLRDAERDGDRILGTIIGGAQNHGGRAGALTAPNAKAQAALVEEAMAGIDPATIGYIEAHGTGTHLGDPVEVNGLKRAFANLSGRESVAEPHIGLGTVKSSIGHLEAAAGLAGVVKVLMAMQRGELPPTLHCDEINPHVDLAGSPFRLVRSREVWPRPVDETGAPLPRRAGVSSFGFGGTNAHVVLEDYAGDHPPQRRPLPPRGFAATRYWIPGVLPADETPSSETLVFVPDWRERKASAGGFAGRRIVVACDVPVEARPGCELVSLALGRGAVTARYGRAAAHLLGVLRDLVKRPGEDKVLVQLALSPAREGALLAGLGAMLDTAGIEDPRILGQVIELPEGLAPDHAARLLASEAGTGAGTRIRYSNGQRFERTWREVPAGVADFRWRPRGVALVTGGMGRLGRLVARDIAQTAKGSVLVLTGSRPLDDSREAFLDELRALGAVAGYRQVDMGDAEAVAGHVAHVIEVHGTLNAVVHCAGTLRDAHLAWKRETDLAEVLAPKVTGALALREACSGLDLDAFVLFSSLAGAFGNAGQADYAAANGFLDALAEHSGGRIASIGWPLWLGGGMEAGEEVQAALFERMGQRPLETGTGLAAMHAILGAGHAQAAVIAGDAARARRFFSRQDASEVLTSEPQAMTGRSAVSSELLSRTMARLGELFATISGHPAGRIDPQAPLEDYGIDSLMITRLNSELAGIFDVLPKTLFFQYRTLAAIAGWLAERQPDACRRWTGLGDVAVSAPAFVAPAQASAAPSRNVPMDRAEPIAVIGLSGRYPGADTLDAFWENLRSGRDMVGEIPAERWSLEGFLEPDADEAVASQRSYSRWGAFLQDFAGFDPLFFRISPRDAAAMDPQERLFLMSAWEACEDAGYTRARLKAVAGGREGADVGVFAGVTKTGYALHGPFRGEGGAMVRPSTSFASVANRVSHALDLAGPSLPVDTMCSSSLTAIHEACEQLRAGHCAMALAGGVNLYLHPSNYVELCASHMLSPSGRCHSFGAAADGFVPGEGVGCVLLKPLSRALADGDRIHAVIRGSAINHGGRANGYTVPSPAAQRDVVRAALEKAGLSARDVSYIEAHGTGTVLGDPIEVDGLTQAFAPDTADTGFCALGSVKSAIGHLEAAAGIAGLTKVILQMRHGMLAPTLHAETVNPNLDLAATPFALQRQAAEWRADGPRIAGISSFGAGGANAHVIVEEWREGPASAAPAPAPQAIVLSARTPEQLRAQAENLLAALRSGIATDTPVSPQAVAAGIAEDLAAVLGVEVADIDPGESFDALGLEGPELLALRRRLEERLPAARLPLLDRFATIETLAEIVAAQGLSAERSAALPLKAVAYTLQVGREAFAHRFGIEAANIDDLAARLGDWLSGKACAGIHTGEAKGVDVLLATLRGDGVLQELAERAWQEGRLDKLLALWAGGIDIDWARLPRSTLPAIVSLPTYPFARDRYWLPQTEAPVGAELERAITAAQGDEQLVAEQDRLDRLVASVLAGQLARVPEEAVTQDLRRWYRAARGLLAQTDSEALSEDDAWARWHASREAGGLAAQMRLAEASLAALPDILTGARKATDVLFPQGSLELVEAVYKQNAVAARFSEALAQAAAKYIGGSRPDRPLRILEIGAGTGGTSEPVFAALAPLAGRITEYCYTDVSRAFLIHAERSYASRVPGLRTALLDIEKPLAGQAVEPGRFDLVVAANVLHATADIVRTLKTVRETMAPEGVLLVNETSRATLFTHVTFGLLDGWWRFTDGERRIPGTPSLAPESWAAALREAGFDWIAGSGEAERRLGQQLFAARAIGARASAAAPAERPFAEPVAVSRPQEAASEVRQDLRGLLCGLVATTLNVAPESIDVTRSFADYGLDSILGAEFAHRLRKALGIPFDQTRLFDFASVGQLEAFLRREHADAVAALNSTDAAPATPLAAPAPAPAPVLARSTESSAEPIAIIGVSGRFAGSQTVEEFWQHLMAGDDLVGPVTRFDLAPHYRHVPEGSYGRHGSFIEDVDRFDAVFFGISGLEATWMDPQQRLFLEEAWKTLEHAGHAGSDIVGSRCGVFVGCAHGDYQELFREQPPGQAFWGNTTSLIPSRLSYWLDLKGPAIALDTACSSSLVAVHMACRSLREGECDMALAGGVFVQSSPRFFLYANQANMLSPSGRCAPFGAGADGIVPGEAVAAVLLKPLSKALADGDTVHGVILGSGTNQDGTTNGITAPSALSQERLMREVYERFGIDPESIAVVEAHGTGTPLGDPIEHAALARVHGGGQAGAKLLGSVKSNIGHATTAAGIAGLIKAVWSLKHAMVPPVLHFGGGNPSIDFSHSPFRVNGEPLAFPTKGGTPRRVAVSSFGFGGTNAHAVLQEAPAQPQAASGLPSFLFVFSASNEALLRQLAERMAAHLETAEGIEAADIAHTLLVGRRPMAERLAIVAGGTRDLVAKLKAWTRGENAEGIHRASASSSDDSGNAALAADCRRIVKVLTASQGADKQAWNEGLQQLAGAWVQGTEIDGTGLFGAGRRRVPLPASPLAAKSYWVPETSTAAPGQPVPRAVAAEVSRTEQRSAPVAPAEPAMPLRLADPAALAGPYEAMSGRKPSIRLAPLEAMAGPAVAQHPQETGGVRLASDQDGVRRLELTGRWGEAMRRELEHALHEAGEDETIRAVIVRGGEAWSASGATAGDTMTTALLDCPLPVVAVIDAPATGDGAASALLADFVVRAEDATLSSLPPLPAGLPWQLAARRVETGMETVAADRVEAAAAELAASIAGAPREALVLLKAHMRKAMPQLVGAWLTGSPKRGRLQQLRLEAGASSPPTMSSRRVPLATSVMELEAFPDGVVLLRMLERAGRNTFTTVFMDGIEEAFAAIATMPEAKIVVLTGHDGYFACGGTSEGLTELQAGEARFTDRRIYSLPLACPLPVIAAMQGHGIGAGWSLGLYCDEAIFATEGLYHSNYLWYGFTPGAGATLIFPHRLGDDLGREVLFSAREYRGRELAHRAPHLDVLPAARVLDEALARAHALARQPKADLTAAKAEGAATVARHLEEVLRREFAMHETTFIGNDRVRARIAEKFGDASLAPVQQPAQASTGRMDPRPHVREQLVASLAEDLMIDVGEIRDDAGFLELGLDSILAVTWIRKLNALFGIELPATVVYAHPTVGGLAHHVARLVPSSAVPQAPARAMPEQAAPVVEAASPVANSVGTHHTEIRERLVASLAEDLMIDVGDIRDDAGFLELGLDSILAVTWIRKLNALFGIELPATVVYAHPTVGALAAHVAGLVPAAAAAQPVAPLVAQIAAPAAPKPAAVAAPTPKPDEPPAVAIIGASGIFPKAGDLDAFWRNIRQGRDCIEEVPASRWDVARFYHPDPAHPGASYCKWMGALDGADLFDAGFFGITPREAELMDPQQRLFLQVAWNAIEDAAIDPQSLAGRNCGIYVSSGPSGYEDLIEERNAYSLLGSSGSILAARMSYMLDLRGPSLSIDTACSSSLVAIAEACESLIAGTCNMALAGGACILVGPKMFIDTSKVSMLSKDGRCFTFDARANGFVPGEGVGAVLLKRLDDALRDGDPIRAVLRGWGTNQDGRTNGITAPNPQAQTALMRSVQARFGIDPATIGLVECHGTGTPLGDPIEIEGLRDAFHGVPVDADCRIGSVKSNIGHCLASAGVAGALKAMLALEQAERPPVVNFDSLNPHISLNGTPFALTHRAEPWPARGAALRRAAVSSYGFSGTNAHLVLEEAPAPARRSATPGPWLLVLSARDRERLQEYAAGLERFVAAHPDLDFGALAHTLQVGRTAFASRLAVAFATREDLLRALASAAAGHPLAGVHVSDGERAATAPFETDEDARALVARWLASGEIDRLSRVGELWAKGLAIDWSILPPQDRLRLPGYPFARQRYWVEPGETAVNEEPATVAPSSLKPHPMLDEGRARGEIARFSVPLTGEEPSLTSHLSADRRLVLGLFLPELARGALERASGRPVHGLRHLLWGSPLAVNGHARQLTVVVGDDGQGLLYRVVADGEEAEPWHFGAAAAEDQLPRRPGRVEPLAPGAGTDLGEAYRAFAERCAIHSGPPAPEAASVGRVSLVGDRLVAELRRPRGEAGLAGGMLFDPAWLDAAWRLLAFRLSGHLAAPATAGALKPPVAIESMAAWASAGERAVLHVEGGNGLPLVLSLYDEQGNACMVMRDVRLGSMETGGSRIGLAGESVR
ncbi:SDR family NAD(P)-dependent oxidoreductase [Stappia indica]|uniref:Acyl transferase domain-containing protein n=1 Tax=Stappia indica TaxID=538381 RepID=A0A285T8I9_9HYPH|nr:SDR family NAD(P)-dependent oxidoreductase [Stappia indica]SOC15856.1 Acyl transferase domain-containing protein [Stappia indica]